MAYTEFEDELATARELTAQLRENGQDVVRVLKAAGVLTVADLQHWFGERLPTRQKRTNVRR